MSQSEKHKFEQEWQRALESATETPPPAAWEGIEARLDARKSAAVVPLAWWRSPRVLYAAAAVAALLLLSWPALRLSQHGSSGKVTSENANSSPEISETDAPKLATRVPETAPLSIRPEAMPDASAPLRPVPTEPQTERLADALSTTPMPPTAPASELPQRLESIAVENQSSRLAPTAVSGLAALPRVSVPKSTQPEEANERNLASDFTPKTGGNNGTTGNGFAPNSGGTSGLTPTIIAITSSSRHAKPEDIERVIMGSSTVPLRTPALTFAIAERSPVGPTEGVIHMAQRAIYYDEAELPAVSRHGRVRELWAGISFMPGLFNPKIDVTSAPAAFSNAKASRESLASASRGQLSYAIQLQGGKRISRHWSVETGVSYLRGNSDFSSPGYVLDATTSNSQNVLENALATSGKPSGNYFLTSNGNKYADLSNAAYIDLNQNSANDYRYVQVPVQAGYTLNPDGRLSYTLLGGVVANLFLQNQIQDNYGETIKTTSDDNIYRSLNWSATTGVRMNYRLAEHWDATLTGTYQKAMASILRDSQTLDSRPQLYGVALGVRYVF